MTAWKPVAEAPDYEVSEHGQIRRCVPDSSNRYMGRILKPSPNTQGYMSVTLAVCGVHKSRTVHGIVCRAFHGPKPDGNFHACHYDGDQTNNAASNLRWATASENMMDKHRHGRMPMGDRSGSRLRPEARPRGAAHANAKLNETDVAFIKTGEGKQVDLARRFGVSQTTISDIRVGKIWTHVQPQGAVRHG